MLWLYTTKLELFSPRTRTLDLSRLADSALAPSPVRAFFLVLIRGGYVRNAFGAAGLGEMQIPSGLVSVFIRFESSLTKEIHPEANTKCLPRVSRGRDTLPSRARIPPSRTAGSQPVLNRELAHAR